VPERAGVPEWQGCPAGDRDGDGIPDILDQCPTIRRTRTSGRTKTAAPTRTTTRTASSDAADKCPYDPEDKDGYEDIDGCPEDDNDGTASSTARTSARRARDMDGDKDEDGCPDNARIVVTKKKVFALEKIYFEFGKADIKRDSFGICDEIARVLLENPEIGRVRVEGHTDDKGSDGFNLVLSQSRVESVRTYLIKKGVPADRLEAVGFGETKPIHTNETPEDGRKTGAWNSCSSIRRPRRPTPGAVTDGARLAVLRRQRDGAHTRRTDPAHRRARARRLTTSWASTPMG